MLRCYILNKNLFNLLLVLLATFQNTSNRVTQTHLTLLFELKYKSQLKSEEVIFKSEVSHV